MEEYDDSTDKQYPRGRGYGNDYMRGGEVFGGYGYKERADYYRPRGELKRQRGERPESTHLDRTFQEPVTEPAPGSQHSLDRPEQAGIEESEPPERFPQDARAGGWPVPHDFDAPTATTEAREQEPREADDEGAGS